MIIRLISFLCIIPLSLQECSWNTCPNFSSSKDAIKVHLIPHTHDDLGWIKTVDQYYYGSKQTLVPVGVQYIYNTVIDELLKDNTKNHSATEHRKLQHLIENGQIELIGGGWVQNDEASAHYVDIIDQMSLGLKKLSQFFGECGKPQVAWQIDPFGHSKEMANIYAMMGYSSLFFARIHYLEKELRLQNRSLEFIWNASDDLKTQILTGAFYQDNYGPPEGFCWDALCGDDPIMDNIELEGYNVDSKIKAFVKHVREQVKAQRSNHVMLLMGSDFQYTNANSWYSNMDKLIRLVNSNNSLGVEVAYSTPSCYVQGLIKSRPHLPTKSDDFFPYASSAHSYWTGYFSSRPTFKGMIRTASAMLQLSKRLAALANLGAETDINLEVMEKASALVQHHDAVTGTAKENVTKDYVKRLHKALIHTENIINDFMGQREAKTSSQTKHSICLLTNETICTVIKDVPTIAVTAFNPAGNTLKTQIRIPYYSRSAIVQNEEGEIVASQLSKTFQSSEQFSSVDRAPYELTINITIPPLGFTTYIIDNSSTIRSTTVRHPVRGDSENNTIENELFMISFDSNGYINELKDKKTNTTHIFRQEFLVYEGIDNSTSQPSGAYIFRPKTQDPVKLSTSVKLEIVKGDLYEEARQMISPWVTQIIRVTKSSAEIVFDWVVGPIPKENDGSPVTKEIVTRYYTDIKSADEFFTDSNGRQMIKRLRNYSPSFSYQNTEPTSGNYYPVTNRIYIKDSKNQLTVLIDRAEGGTAKDGMIELMLHRRCFYDDHWGVEEALDEPGLSGKGLVARGTHVLLWSSAQSAPSLHRPIALNLFHKPVIAFAKVEEINTFKKNNKLSYSGLTRSLPEYLNLLSLEKWTENSLLIRLEHLYQNEEDKECSKPKIIDIKNMFSEFEITAMQELKLAGNQQVSPSARTKRYKNFKVELQPMEIKTFQVQVQRSK